MQQRNTKDGSDSALMRVGDVAQELAISARTVWRLISEGQLSCVRIGKCVRIPRTSVAAFVAKGGA